MTRAKAYHLAARRLLIEHLDIHPGRVVDADLDPAEVGIVGSAGHVRAGTSYHLGKRDLIMTKKPYSVVESGRDRAGLDNYASAMDIGKFRVTTPLGVFDLRHFSLWLVRLCQVDDPDTQDIREVIYSPDGLIVLRWDDLGIRDSGDDSHLDHTHVSEYRDADGSRMLRLVRRYLVEIGLLAGEDDDMALTDKVKLVTGQEVAYTSPTSTVEGVLASTNYYVIQGRNAVLAELADAKVRDEAILAAVTGGGQAEVLAAIRAQGEQTRRQLADQAQAEAARDAELRALVQQGRDGTLDAAEVVHRIGELLTAGTTTQP